MAFKLVVISSPSGIPREAELLECLFRKGLGTLHIRKPGVSRAEVRALLTSIPIQFHKRIVIHSHYSLVKEFALKGIHLTESTRKKTLPLAFDPKKHTLSASFHSLRDIARSRRRYDYLFLSPVFDSLSKKNYRAAFDKVELKEFVRKDRRVIALGGIEPATLDKVKQMGFAGAASLGYIWESKDPVRAFDRLVSQIK